MTLSICPNSQACTMRRVNVHHVSSFFLINVNDSRCIWKDCHVNERTGEVLLLPSPTRPTPFSAWDPGGPRAQCGDPLGSHPGSCWMSCWTRRPFPHLGPRRRRQKATRLPPQASMLAHKRHLGPELLLLLLHLLFLILNQFNSGNAK